MDGVIAVMRWRPSRWVALGWVALGAGMVAAIAYFTESDGPRDGTSRPSTASPHEAHQATHGLRSTAAQHDATQTAQQPVHEHVATGEQNDPTTPDTARSPTAATTNLAAKGLTRVADHPDPAPNGKVIPHPFDAPRKAMQERRQLWASVKLAIERREFERARHLLAHYDEHHAGQGTEEDFREGYQLILDCKEDPSPQAQQRGQRFVDEQRGSTLRRSVRRACLGER